METQSRHANRQRHEEDQDDSSRSADLVAGNRYGDTNIGGDGRPFVVNGDFHGDVKIYNFGPPEPALNKTRTLDACGINPSGHNNYRPRIHSFPATCVERSQTLGVAPLERHNRGPFSDDVDTLAEEWCELLRLNVLDVKVVVTRSGEDSEILLEQYTECTVTLESHPVELEDYPLRRIRFPGSRSNALWLPQTRVDVFSHGSRAKIRFSNCNKFQPPGPYPTRNGRRKSILTYNPEDPNVDIDFTFKDEEDCRKFKYAVLCKGSNVNSDHMSGRKFSYCTVLHQKRQPSSGDTKQRVLLWTHRPLPRTNEIHEIHDEVSLTNRIDLKVVNVDSRQFVSVGYMDWLKYHPAEHPPALDHNVPQTPDGRPNRVEMGGGESPNSTIMLPTTVPECKELLNSLLDLRSEWKCRGVFPQASMKLSSPSSGFARILSRGSGKDVQLSVWTRRSKVKLLMRAVTGDEDESQEKQKLWTVIILRIRNSNDRPFTDHPGETATTTEDVRCEQGLYLSIDELRPHTSENTSIEATWTNLKLGFQVLEDRATFKEIIKHAYVHGSDQR